MKATGDELAARQQAVDKEAARLKAAADRAEAARKVKLPAISDSAPFTDSADTHSSLTCSGRNRSKFKPVEMGVPCDSI